MVNSKKMRKSTVAIVLLSILLCLSMILTATGAWYTASGDANGNNNGSFTLRDRWIDISLEATAGTIQAYRSDKTTTVANDEVMPGDYIKADGTTFKVTATLKGADESIASVDAYVFLVNADGKYVQMRKLTNGSTEAEFDVIDLAVTGTGIGAKGEGGFYQVNTNLEYSTTVQTVASYTIGAYSVKAIQAENIADEAAAAAALNLQKAA